MLGDGLPRAAWRPLYTLKNTTMISWITLLLADICGRCAKQWHAQNVKGWKGGKREDIKAGRPTPHHFSCWDSSIPLLCLALYQGGDHGDRNPQVVSKGVGY